MNKKLLTWFNSKNFNINENRVYGKINNYEVNFSVDIMNNNNGTFPIIGCISFYATDSTKMSIIHQIENLKVPNSQFKVVDYGIIWGISCFSYNKYVRILDENIIRIITIIDENITNSDNSCPFCGNELVETMHKKCQINEFTIDICNNCIHNINEEIEVENKEFQLAPNNYGKGLIGIFLGSLVGIVVAYIFNIMGFISAISSIASLYVSIFLYKKMGGKENFVMIIMAAVVTIVMQSLFVFGLYIMVANNLTTELNLSTTGFSAFIEAMKENNDFRKEFISNLVMTVLFAVFGSGFESFTLVRKLKRPKSID